jgi:hypothetical protein
MEETTTNPNIGLFHLCVVF